MAEVSGPRSGQSPPPNAGPRAEAKDAFYEPIGRQWLSRTGDQPLTDWLAGLPRGDVGLSTLEGWQAGSTPEATARTIETELRARIAPALPATFGGASLIDGIRREYDDIKVGYAMGQVAAGIEARVADSPGVPAGGAVRLAAELRNRGAALSLGAAREATTVPGSYNFNGRCYADADALARAVTQERLNPSGPVLRAYTPAMQQRDAQAAMDRAVLGQSSPLGVT
jgi:hypothetical protein